MNYIRLHHLWQPLAAISAREELSQSNDTTTAAAATTTSSSSMHNSSTMIFNAPTNRIINTTTILSAMITKATTTSSSLIIDEANANASSYQMKIDQQSSFRDYFNYNINVSNNDTYDEGAIELLNGNGNDLFNVILDVYSNNYTNASNGETDQTWQLITMIGTAVALGLLILATVIGNVFVIAAILLERNLQNVANYLILSLAVADLLVACLVMPLGAVYEVSHEWTLGPELCDMWTSSDVLCCTASILHLVAIALDRYWAVTNIDYIHHRTAKRIGIMILIVWCVAFLVCIAPLLGWKDPGWSARINDKKCIVSQDIGYQIFATASSFYLPLMVILILYWRIFQTARKRIRRRQIVTNATQQANKNPAAGGIAGGLAAASGTGGIAAAVVTIIGRPLPTISETTTAFTTVSSNNTSPEKTSFANGLDDPPTTTDGGGGGTYQTPQYPIKRKLKDSADSKRERKAAKTLAIITGAFVICWLPFFMMAILLPIYKDMFKEYIISLFLWLGYFNSTLNPIIYTIFSPEFRHAFKKILFGRNYARKRNRHFGIRHFQ